MSSSTPTAVLAALLVTLAAVTAGATGAPEPDPPASGPAVGHDPPASGQFGGSGPTGADPVANPSTGTVPTGPSSLSIFSDSPNASDGGATLVPVPPSGPPGGSGGGRTGAANGSNTSEGVATIDADRAHAAGYTGENVTVAVVDLGFDLDDPSIADSVVATRDYTATGIDNGTTRHGTAAAGIVADTAPNASLVLVSVDSEGDLLAAIDWLGNETDTDVVSMSLGLVGGPLDGSTALDRAVEGSVANGTVWAVSSGNEANSHWSGAWRDDDGDDRLAFAPGDDRLNLSGPVRVTVQWDDWPDSDRDYDAYLLNASGDVVAGSTTVQNGSQPPRETISYGGIGDAWLVVERVDAPGDAEFDVFVQGSTVEHAEPNGSLVVPATANGSIAVGAVDHRNGTLEVFSSRGPTADGRRKPELVAPDRVSTTAYESFAGTSAAAPHAAGAAALVLDADPTLDPRGVLRRLARNASPVTGTEPNNATGWGLVDVDDSIRPAAPQRTAIATQRVNESTAGAVAVEVTFPAPPEGGSVEVQLRDAENGSVTASGPADTTDNTTTVTVDAAGLADGTLTASARVTDALNGTSVGGFTAESAPVPKNTTVETTCQYSGTVAGVDENDDCAVSDGEVNTAIADWAAGDFSDGEIGDVIAAWAAS